MSFADIDIATDENRLAMRLSAEPTQLGQRTRSGETTKSLRVSGEAEG